MPERAWERPRCHGFVTLTLRAIMGRDYYLVIGLTWSV